MIAQSRDRWEYGVYKTNGNNNTINYHFKSVYENKSESNSWTDSTAFLDSITLK